MTIFDVNTPYVDRYFIWTALTRATDFKNITIYEHSQEDVISLRQSKVKQYFEHKVDNYKRQDKKAGRKWIEEEYISADWFNNEYHKLTIKSCISCKTPYEIPHIDHNANVTSTLTADRINNSLPHTTNNVRLICLNCNRIRGNKY